MIRSPYEECPPDTEVNQAEFRCKRDENGIWEMFCPQWKCCLHGKQLGPLLHKISSEIDELNLECSMTKGESEEYVKLLSAFGIKRASKRGLLKPRSAIAKAAGID